MLKFALAAALAFCLGAAPVVAASGTALGVDQDASAETGGVLRVLQVGADINIGDRVITDANGLVQIKFDDKTELVVGPNSALVIEDYLLREDGSAGKLAINALNGTFRFVTGSAPKDRYLITTPTGTIGVRGTALDFVVADTTKVLVYNGVVILCDLDNNCIEIDENCEIGEADSAEAKLLGIGDDFTGEERDALQEEFRYAMSQGDLNREFWIENARRCLNLPASQGGGGGGGSTKGGVADPCPIPASFEDVPMEQRFRIWAPEPEFSDVQLLWADYHYEGEGEGDGGYDFPDDCFPDYGSGYGD